MPLVGRAVERAHRAHWPRRSPSGPPPLKMTILRRRVALALRLEQRGPLVLGRGEHLAGEAGGLARRRRVRPRRRLGPWPPPHRLLAAAGQAAEAAEDRNRTSEHDDAADAEAAEDEAEQHPGAAAQADRRRSRRLPPSLALDIARWFCVRRSAWPLSLLRGRNRRAAAGLHSRGRGAKEARPDLKGNSCSSPARPRSSPARPRASASPSPARSPPRAPR